MSNKKNECYCEHDHEQNVRFNTENDLNIAIIKDGKDLLINEDCCTCINIMLKNDGQILTSFLGSHNEYIVSQLEQAQKYYFKSLKKALKAQVLEQEYAHECSDHCHCDDDCGCDEHCDEDNCDCNEHDCNCSENCTCGDDCNCTEEHKCNENCTCGEHKHKKTNKPETKKKTQKK